MSDIPDHYISSKTAHAEARAKRGMTKRKDSPEAVAKRKQVLLDLCKELGIQVRISSSFVYLTVNDVEQGGIRGWDKAIRKLRSIKNKQ